MEQQAKLVIPGITDEITLACIARSRNYPQYVREVNNALSGICPFCKIDREYNKIVAENDFWYAWPCKPPEKNTCLHFLFVPKRHVTLLNQLADVEHLALWGDNGIRMNVHRMFNYFSCGTQVRDGDARLSAGTVEHLHVHDMVPDGTGRVESPFFKGAESEAEGVARARVFEKIRCGAGTHTLTEDEWKLVNGRF